MNMQLIGKNIEITPALKSLIESKLETVTRHYQKILSIHITLHIEGAEQIAETMLHIAGTDLHAKSASHDMYKSIDDMLVKLNTQLIKHKEKTIESHR